jgi:DNA polymerase
MKERGHWIDDEATGRRVLVTLHPSALLRGDPAQREAAWKAWLKDLSVASSLMKKAAVKQAAAKPPARPAAGHARRRVRMVME